MKLPLLICGFCLAVAARAGAGPARPVPADFDDNFERLAALVDQDELSPLEMAQGSYYAAKFFAVGPTGLPVAQARFAKALTPGQASMAGLYLTVHGKPEQVNAMRQELESNRMKRKWLYAVVGNEENFLYSLESGQQWTPLIRVLPSTQGARDLASSCIHSRDALVRRAGLYWGYWVPSPSYWREVKRVAGDDPDGVTRAVASRLLKTEERARK